VCNFEANGCVFPESCDKVNTNFYMTFKVNDNKGGFYTFSLSNSYLKVPGSLMGDAQTKCYIPVFSHGLADPEDSKVIIMGNIMMSKYYLVYDMSPLEQSKDYIQIAFGFKNEINVLRDQYNPSSPSFNK
jgi:hypothetical protein